MPEGRRFPTFTLDTNVIIHALSPGQSDERMLVLNTPT